MPGPFISRDYTHFAQLEAAYATSPGALAAGDAFKCKSPKLLTRAISRHDRDQDKDNNQASVFTTQKGREHATWSMNSDIIPSGNPATPTAPDQDPFFEAHLGEKFTATAHTTTAAGSTGVTLNLTPGGGAASGIRAGGGDIIMVDVSTAVGMEARRVVSRSTDVVTVDRPFTTDPAAARNVHVGTTYRPLESAEKTLHIWEYLNGNNFRHKGGGCIPRELSITIDFAQENPVSEVTFSGDGQQETTQSTSIPTPTTAGEPHLPTEGKVFIGASGRLSLVKAEISSNNGLEQRMSESTPGLLPSGVKRTGNNSRYQITLSLDMLLTTGAVEGYYDGAGTLTAYDVIIQLGTVVGKTVVISFPKFVPDAVAGDQDGEVSVQMSGRAYALTLADTEMSIAFL